MQKISPFLWFDTRAEQAMQQYVSAFPNSTIRSVSRYPDTAPMPEMSGLESKVLTGVFELAGQRFMALDGGDTFKFTPAASLFVYCDSESELDHVWAALSPNATTLMPLQAYPFSPKFGWLADQYGLSWQVSLGARAQKIVPSLMFVGAQHGKAEAAMRFYTSLFDDSRIDHIEHYAAHEDSAGTVKQGFFTLHGRTFQAMDSSFAHDFTFSEAFSLFVECETQAEVDRLWDALSAHPEFEQCGWLKDQFGVSWQIIPTALPTLMNDPDPQRAARVLQAVGPMKKIDIAGLQRAYDGV